MRWEVLVIPLIGLGVWILSTIFKTEDDKTKKGPVRRGNVPGRPPGRRVVTDLDRFLEEARRRREPEERPKAPPQPTRAPIERPPLRERPTRVQEPPRPATPVRAKEEPLVALPVPRPAAPPVAAPAPSSSLSRETPPPPAPAVRTPPISQQVRSLLIKPQTAATAFVLREIFDRPLCKRRR